MEQINQLEAEILVWIQNHIRLDFLDGIMPGISVINNGGMLAILTVILLVLIRRYRMVGIAAFGSLATEFFLVNLLLKPFVKRSRPFWISEELNLLGSVPEDFSFPSGHTGSAFAVATVMLLCLPRRYGVPAIIVAALIAFSRVYNAAHYPTDVLGGMLIGAATGMIASMVWRYVQKRRERIKE